MSYLRKFGCVVYAPILSPQHTTMGPHRKLGIYVGYHSPSIIKYLEPMTGDLFMAQYDYCIFNDDHFLVLGGEFQYNLECLEINDSDRKQAIQSK
jgi:hypothetical protein